MLCEVRVEEQQKNGETQATYNTHIYHWSSDKKHEIESPFFYEEKKRQQQPANNQQRSAFWLAQKKKPKSRVLSVCISLSFSVYVDVELFHKSAVLLAPKLNTETR